MSGGKKIVKSIIFSLVGVLLGGLIGNLARNALGDAPDAQIVMRRYAIDYVYMYDGAEKAVDEFLFASEGSYPVTYSYKYGAEISPLLGEMEKTEFEGKTCWVGSEVSDPNEDNTSYAFYGWYWDPDYERPFDGKIAKGTIGDIKLYAKISVSWWTDFY